MPAWSRLRNRPSRGRPVAVDEHQTVESYDHLPYTDELITVLVINEAGLNGKTVPDSEIIRTSFSSDRSCTAVTPMTLQTTAMPNDVDGWKHYVYGPERIPLSNDTRVGP